MRRDLEIRSDVASRRHCLFCPGLPKGPHAELLSMLPAAPGASALAAAWPALRAARAKPVLGVLAVDPFLRLDDLIRSLRSAGITEVANYPTMALHDGEFGMALDEAGIGARAEFAFVAALASAGFAPLAYVTGPQGGRAMLAAGAQALVLHPGLAVRDRSDMRHAAECTQANLVALRALAGERPVLLHRPRGFSRLLDSAIATADGEVRLA